MIGSPRPIRRCEAPFETATFGPRPTIGVSVAPGTAALGPVDDKFHEAYEAAREILHTVAAEAGPGRAPSALYDRAVELAGDREGFMGAGEERVSFVGHGFGLEIDELPVLTPGADEPLVEGMVFALEPKFVYPGEGAVGVENSYAVTADGVEQLTTAPEELFEL